MNFAPWPSLGSMPFRKSRLPDCTASTWVPDRSGGAWIWMPSSFNRCSAPAALDSPRIISVLPFGFVPMFISFSKLALEMRPEWRRLYCNDLDSSGVCHGARLTQPSQARRTRMPGSDQTRNSRTKQSDLDIDNTLTLVRGQKKRFSAVLRHG